MTAEDKLTGRTGSALKPPQDSTAALYNCEKIHLQVFFFMILKNSADITAVTVISVKLFKIIIIIIINFIIINRHFPYRLL